VTDEIGFQESTIDTHGVVDLGIRWVPCVTGKHVLEVFALDGPLSEGSSPHLLADKGASLVEIAEAPPAKKNVGVFIPGGSSSPQLYEGRPYYRPPVVTVVIGCNNTVVWDNHDTVPHYLEMDGDNSNPGFAKALKDSMSIAPGESFVYTFDRPGTFGYHGQPWMRGTVVVLPDQYEGMERVSDDWMAAMAGETATVAQQAEAASAP